MVASTRTRATHTLATDGRGRCEPAVTPLAGLSDDDILAGSIFMGQSNLVAQLFIANHAQPPAVRWSPNRFDLRNEMFERFLAHCWSLPTHAGLPLADEFDPAATPYPDWLQLLEAERFGRDFRFLHYGERIAENFSRSFRALRVSDIGGHVGRFFVALYRSAMQRRQVVLSEHEPPRAVFVRLWRRLIVPLVDAQGYVTRFAVLIQPENDLRAGLDVVPMACIVADAQRRVCFANEAARALVPEAALLRNGTPLAACLAGDLALPQTPAALLEPAPRQIRLEARLMRPGGALQPVAVVAGATRYRDTPFFVLTLQAG
ncbi:hypothetical protein LNKW23_12780 [Paralimibaculum aggregatum]|uniref:PAS domain-containing protein n=1 Tax=Paralimibaculum aggregatum TaxID=3036245 RepID=A0ABQ6LFF6_9RHOB|nr:hypothetical protein [Limibaculum sp. NKW23]GMG82065.1 hypothetical protein LNKW23_12780 [Limibaculum sp. NKW23]